MIFGLIKDWLRRRFTPPARLDDATWNRACAKIRAVSNLSSGERRELRELAAQFLHEKEFIAAEDFDLNAVRRYAIAIQACIPILYMGIQAYRGWRSIYVFPDTFTDREEPEWHPEDAEEDGAFADPHVDQYAGVAVPGGGVGLAWSEVRHGSHDDEDGYNPVIHEFAHKLDMLDGGTDGRPPLPPGVTQKEWFETFSQAFTDFRERVTHGEETGISDYAATNPAEFFAVLSEVYFEDPEVIEDEYPEVLRLLQGFYTQNRARLP